MDKRLEKSLEINSGITEEFEELSKDCFERIFDMLGKKNFERWINKRQLAPRIKELVIESMGEKEKKENPQSPHRQLLYFLLCILPLRGH